MVMWQHSSSTLHSAGSASSRSRYAARLASWRTPKRRLSLLQTCRRTLRKPSQQRPSRGRAHCRKAVQSVSFTRLPANFGFACCWAVSVPAASPPPHRKPGASPPVLPPAPCPNPAVSSRRSVSSASPWSRTYISSPARLVISTAASCPTPGGRCGHILPARLRDESTDARVPSRAGRGGAALLRDRCPRSRKRPRNRSGLLRILG